MMKRIAIYLFLLLNNCCLFSQFQRDNNWLFGSPPNLPNINEGGSMINFDDSLLEITYFEIPFDFEVNSIISDHNGNLLFYTNGCEIANQNHEIMVNGDSINAGEIHDSACEFGYPQWQGAMILQQPEKDSIFYLFHLLQEKNNFRNNIVFQKTIINMNRQNGLGEVVSKNEIILEDYFTDQITAVRHGNGRDWWLILPKWESNLYYIFLFDPKGIHLIHEQSIGNHWNWRDWAGQVVFTPDGSKYIRGNAFHDIQIFDFDRCEGMFSNALTLALPIESQDSISLGLGVSSDSRFLYASTYTKIHQFDLNANDIKGSLEIVAEFDGYESPFPTYFFQQMLAPDEKIYLTSLNGVDVLHVIHQPNAKGLACEVEQHGVQLPSRHSFQVPNFPYFRLYDLPDSPCDTLGIDGPIVATEEVEEEELGIKVYPNPTKNDLFIKFNTAFAGEARIIDLSGQVVFETVIPKYTFEKQITLKELPSGIYTLTISGQNKTLVFQEKIVILK